DDNGNIVSRSKGEGESSAYVVDELDLVISANNDLSDETGYQYNKVHKVIELDDANAHAACTQYDHVYRRACAIDALTNSVDYVYDGVGNLLTLTAHDASTNHTTTYEYDAANRRASESYPDDEDSH